MMNCKAFATASVACAAVALTLIAATPETLSAQDRSGDQFLVVDCLLPGKIRKLGTKATFMTARRAVRTTASDCEIRGGEYTSSDRSNYATALKIWLPLAQDGDPAAQNYVGEIYEKGLGVEPQHELAAAWYLKAAKQGYARAQINLGALYERGLGVPQDKAKAVEWYRRASGLGEADLAYVPADVKQELEELRAERDTLARERDALRGELKAVQDELERAKERLRQQQTETDAALGELQAARSEIEARKQKASQAGDRTKLAELEAELAAKDAEVAARQQELARLKSRVSSLDGEAARLKSALASAESEAESARDQLGRQQARLAERERELEVLREADRRNRAEAAGIRAELERERASADRDDTKVRALETGLAAREADLKARDSRIAELDRQIGGLRDEVEELRTEQKAERIAMAPPTIQMIEPPIATEATRAAGDPAIAIRAEPERVIIGKVDAPGGLIALIVNDAERETSDGIFRVAVPVSHPETPVKIVAIDARGQRAALSFVMRPDGPVATRAASGAAPEIRKQVDFGKFHALVIGSNDYRYLPKLETAVNDAKAVEELLRTRYGFKTTLLLNADRYAILSALNKLREELDEDSNLLIYYAGHGELDRVNDRGNWLPIDAEPNSTANWISNIQITDVLNAMTVRQVMVVADSCYSGTLTRAALAQLDAGMSDKARANWIKLMAGKRARVALTSGSVQPVVDRGGRGDHSVFASAFLDVLASNDGVLEGQRVYLSVSQRMSSTVAAEVDQTPQYAPIKYAGHEAGDFFFVPVVN